MTRGATVGVVSAWVGYRGPETQRRDADNAGHAAGEAREDGGRRAVNSNYLGDGNAHDGDSRPVHAPVGTWAVLPTITDPGWLVLVVVTATPAGHTSSKSCPLATRRRWARCSKAPLWSPWPSRRSS